jgi:hypothetical protein
MEKPVRRLAACVLAALLSVVLWPPSSQAAVTSMDYVAPGDSCSAASGVLRWLDPQLPARHRRRDRRAAHRSDL